MDERTWYIKDVNKWYLLWLLIALKWLILIGIKNNLPYLFSKKDCAETWDVCQWEEMFLPLQNPGSRLSINWSICPIFNSDNPRSLKLSTGSLLGASCSRTTSRCWFWETDALTETDVLFGEWKALMRWLRGTVT